MNPIATPKVCIVRCRREEGIAKSYYWVATKTCVVRAISKDVLTKAGLISCLGYYNERHALNRRMPDGTYGGVRGERKSPLLDFEEDRKIISSIRGDK